MGRYRRPIQGRLCQRRRKVSQRGSSRSRERGRLSRSSTADLWVEQTEPLEVGRIVKKRLERHPGVSIAKCNFRVTAGSASARAVLRDVGAALLGSFAAGTAVRRVGPQQEGFSGLIRRTFKPTARPASAPPLLRY